MPAPTTMTSKSSAMGPAPDATGSI